MPLYWPRPTSQTNLSRWIISTVTTAATTPWTEIYAASLNLTTLTSSTWPDQTATLSRTVYFPVYHATATNWTNVDATQYLALARERVTISAERQVEIARMREAARRQQQEQAEERARIYALQQRDIALARERSRELLLAHLTPRQRSTFESLGWFIVHGGKSDTKYRIRADRISANIEVFEGDRMTHKLCGHLRHDLPLFDHVLAQKVSLELDEENFVRICNRHAA